MRKNIKKGDVARKILLTLSAETTDGAILIFDAPSRRLSPVIQSFTDWYKSQNRQGRYRIRKSFGRLKQTKLIEMSETEGGKTKIVLTKEGWRKVLKYQFDDLKIKSMEKWDKKWRIIIFDIPENQKKARNALRAKLQELGFEQLQKSVWIHPYECREEINFIINFFNIAPYIKIIQASRFEDDGSLKEKFGL